MMMTTEDLCTLPAGLQGPRPGAKPREGVHRRVPGGQALAHGVWTGSARKGDISPSPPGPTTHKRSHRGPVLSGLGVSQRPLAV